MRVAIVAYGHADNVLCLSKHLSKYAEVTLIFLMSGNHFTRSIFDWDISKLPYGLTTDSDQVNSYLGKKILSYVDQKVNIFLARTPTQNIIKDWQRENVKYIKEVSQHLNANQYDVVHFNGSSGFQMYFHYYLNRKPKVYTIHDYLPHSGEASFRRRLTNKYLNRFLTCLDCEFVQHYQFLSRKFSEFYKVRADRVHTVYCGALYIYRVFMNESLVEEPATILFFGRISPYKGIEYLMNAFPVIKERVPEAKLVIAGEGDFWFPLKHDTDVEIHNHHIANDELVNIIQRATLVVAPYTDATHSAVIMTAYAFNKPVVASAVGGIPEVVEDNVTGRLVPPRDSDSLANAIIDLLSDPQKRCQMKNNVARKCSETQLSWDNIAKETIEVYEKAMASHR